MATYRNARVAAKLDQIRYVLAALDWERDDRQYALEQIRRIVTAGTAVAMPPRYVPDPRASDEAWAVTTPVHIDLGAVAELPEVTGGDDARRAAWLPCDYPGRPYTHLAAALDGWYGGQVFAAHVAMLREFLCEVA
jgi:ADP-ribose pyrophosphatase